MAKPLHFDHRSFICQCELSYFTFNPNSYKKLICKYFNLWDGVFAKKNHNCVHGNLYVVATWLKSMGQWCCRLIKQWTLIDCQGHCCWLICLMVNLLVPDTACYIYKWLSLPTEYLYLKTVVKCFIIQLRIMLLKLLVYQSLFQLGSYNSTMSVVFKFIVHNTLLTIYM